MYWKSNFYTDVFLQYDAKGMACQLPEIEQFTCYAQLHALSQPQAAATIPALDSITNSSVSVIFGVSGIHYYSNRALLSFLTRAIIQHRVKQVMEESFPACFWYGYPHCGNNFVVTNVDSVFIEQVLS